MSVGAKLTRPQRDAIERFVAEHGEVGAAAALGVTRDTLARAAAGFGVRRDKVAAMLAVVVGSNIDTGGAEARDLKVDTRACERPIVVDEPEREAESARGGKMQKILIPLDAELRREIEARRRNVPLDRPVLSTAQVVRELIRRGIAASSSPATPPATVPLAFAPPRVVA